MLLVNKQIVVKFKDKITLVNELIGIFVCCWADGATVYKNIF